MDENEETDAESDGEQLNHGKKEEEELDAEYEVKSDEEYEEESDEEYEKASDEEYVEEPEEEKSIEEQDVLEGEKEENELDKAGEYFYDLH